MNIPPIKFPTRVGTWLAVHLLLSAVIGLLAGGVFALMAGHSPLAAFRLLISAGFSCRGWDRCAMLTTFQFATPLILAGLSAAVAFRVGFFSIGQAGQMVLGAALAAWIGHRVLPSAVHVLFAMLGAALLGAIWATIPALIKLSTGVHEIIVTVVMNSIAGYLVGFIPGGLGRIAESARLASFAPGTKLNAGFLWALGASAMVYILLWRSAAGYEQRMVGQAPEFARHGGQNRIRAVLGAMFLSGALAGLAGSVEVLGVHYRYISNFSADVNFDGVMVALLGQSHPLGVLLAGVFVGGIRLGSLNGLLIQAGIPRELGNAILAVMTIFMAAPLIAFKGVLVNLDFRILATMIERPHSK